MYGEKNYMLAKVEIEDSINKISKQYELGSLRTIRILSTIIERMAHDEVINQENED